MEQEDIAVIELTKSEAYSLADFISMNLIDIIRNDTEIDSMQWIRNIVHAYEKLCEYSGYKGYTEDLDEKENKDAY